ncbi:protein-disulfide reductase DsbD family protein [Marinicellulosiphila megalodicopiae]|uniref:protein-disulfide reductase DsbD family protein n=1 Tax=Marinicellulosiphila megalodicopiae TaxID=2724896 RepID=UPI003BAEE2E4
MNKLISLFFMFMLSMNVMATEDVIFLDEADAYHMSFASDTENQELVVSWKMEDGYYLYKDKIAVAISEDVYIEPSKISYSNNFKNKNDEIFGDIDVYYKTAEVRFKMDVTTPTIFTLEYQGCADAGLCYPPQDREVTFYPAGTEGQTADFAIVEPFKFSTFLLVLLMALGGGMILNLMPCVFPVLAMKAMTFVQSAGHEKIENIRHSWAYTIGVVVSFLIVGGALLVLKIFFGVDVSWGKQLSSPYVLMAMIYIFFFIGLMLYGFTTVGTSLMGVGQGLTEDTGLKGSFFTGVLATLVATPCTGPLMAPPLLFALTQPPQYGLLVFIALGFGMALPMLLIAYIPAAARMMPRPGAWMEVFKQGMSFPMFAAVIWLGDVLLAVVGADGIVLAAGGMLGLMFYFWPSFHKVKPASFGKFFLRTAEIFLFIYVVYLSAKEFDSIIAVAASIAALVVLIVYYKMVLNVYTPGFYEIFGKITNVVTKITLGLLIIVWVPYNLANPEPEKWLDFKEVDLEELIEKGPVFVDATAEWCITCKANEAVSMHDGFFKMAEEKGIALVEADFTSSDPEILAFLRAHNRVSVPLYVLFIPGQDPIYLPQTHTSETITNAFMAIPDLNSDHDALIDELLVD